MNYTEHKAMLAALETGTATPDQQRAAHAHLQTITRRHNQEMRESERDSRDAYSEGISNAAAESRGEPYGTY